MPIFFFDVSNHVALPDTTGADFADAVQARMEAVRFAGKQLADRPGVLWDGTEFRVRVLDERRQHVSSIVVYAIDAPATKKEMGVA